MMNFNNLIKKSHELAKEKGWWDSKRTIPEVTMMIVVELSEAIQEHRTNGNSDKFKEELADTFIRLFDMIGYLGIDIEKEIVRKMKINEKRPRLHGKKY